MRTPFRNRLKRFFAFAALGVLVGCNSNFIPVPPPGDPTFEAIQVADASGTPRQIWQVSGADNEAMKGARVYVLNLNLGSGVIATASAQGGYTSGPFEGAPGDRVELHYESPTADKSPSLCRLLQAGVARTPCN